MTTTPALITREDLHSLTTAITGLTEAITRLTPPTPPTGLRIPEGPARPLPATAAGITLPEPAPAREPVSPAFKPIGDAYKDLPKCGTCERPLRPYKAQPAHWPGTMARANSKECTTCYAHRLTGSKPRKPAVITQTDTTVPMDQLPVCPDCGKTMRPRGTTIERYPGTIAYSGIRCTVCRKRLTTQQKHERDAAKDRDRDARRAATAEYRAEQRAKQQAQDAKEKAEKAENLRLKAKAEAEASAVDREQRLVRELDSFLAARRKRGAPAEGIHFEGEETKCRTKSATASP